jgi:protein-tyrosine phosphatase
VVSRCIEYDGPIQEYEAHGIRQLRLPTVDTSSPEYEQVVKVRVTERVVNDDGGDAAAAAGAGSDDDASGVVQGVEFIEGFLAENQQKRVLIHCKGGR